MNTIKKAVITVPTYLEAANIATTIHSIFDCVLSDQKRDWHVLIFDSASNDGTAEIVKDLQAKYANLHFLTESHKTGLGSAYAQALSYAVNELAADLVFEFDADLSHQPKYLMPMADKLEHCDVIIGSRYVAGGSIPADWAWYRKFLSGMGNKIIRLVLSRKYKDFTSGFRGVHGEVYRKLLPKKFISNDYSYKIHLLWILHKADLIIKEFPIEFIDRTQGQSKLPTNSIRDTFRTLFLLRAQDVKKFFRMGLVGFYGMLLQIIIYRYVRHFFTPFYSTQLAVLLTMLNNYIWHHSFTFRSSHSIFAIKRLKILAIFLLYSGFTILMQASIVSLGVHYFGEGKLQENILMLTAVGLASFINYFFYSRLIWRQ
jgi:dolichol-phosphate mannosyltransferase